MKKTTKIQLFFIVTILLIVSIILFHNCNENYQDTISKIRERNQSQDQSSTEVQTKSTKLPDIFRISFLIIIFFGIVGGGILGVVKVLNEAKSKSKTK